MIAWSGIPGDAADEHCAADGDVPHVPVEPGVEYDSCAGRIHADDMGSIDPFGPSLWSRFKAWCLDHLRFENVMDGRGE